ncbi:16S rRNA (guanine(966)-N(2))-methyltransferase RsmD [Pelotomaculum propionicicum]|uniref:16S rRNA (guanine(966)-N(2))-methyltransferase RsmD n=1 Tax=Pelotomaculum propionicicum TaxID=258475 RepID=UPI003B76109F
MLRVISGSAKKRKLKTPPGMGVRPTSDRVKEALFNILGNSVPDCSFLDLFAGSGNIGIEALSRGAASAVFVENNYKNLLVIKENLHLTGLEDKARLIRGEVAAVLSGLGLENQAFDIIFLDPPYLKDYEIKTLAAIARHRLLKPDGRVIVESSKNQHLPPDAGGLEIIRQEKYGDTVLSFYRYMASAGEGD